MGRAPGGAWLVLAFALVACAHAGGDADHRLLRRHSSSSQRDHLTPDDLPMTSLISGESVVEPAAQAEIGGGGPADLAMARVRKTCAYIAVQKRLQRGSFANLKEPVELYVFGTEEQMALMTTCLIWTCLATLAAFYYKACYEEPSHDLEMELDKQEFREFRHGLFACHEAPQTCLLTVFCPGMRMARTMSYVVLPDGRRMGYWVVFFTFVSLHLFADISGEFFLYCLAALFLCVFRDRMRQAFEMKRSSGGKLVDPLLFLQDFLAYMCCMCCAITQDTRQVEDAFKAGHPCVETDDPDSDVEA